MVLFQAYYEIPLLCIPTTYVAFYVIVCLLWLYGSVRGRCGPNIYLMKFCLFYLDPLIWFILTLCCTFIAINTFCFWIMGTPHLERWSLCWIMAQYPIHPISYVNNWHSREVSWAVSISQEEPCWHPAADDNGIFVEPHNLDRIQWAISQVFQLFVSSWWIFCDSLKSYEIN